MHDDTSDAAKEPKRGRGRPASITLEVVRKVARLMGKGLTEEQACLRFGINHGSLRRAKHRNADFETAIKEGMAEFADQALDRIAAGSRGRPGLAWILERRHGDQFRKNTWVDFNGQMRTFSLADLLRRKPVGNWNRQELEEFVASGMLSQSMSQEQWGELHRRLEQEWGPIEGVDGRTACMGCVWRTVHESD